MVNAARRLFAGIALFALLAGCAGLPPNNARTPSHALEDTAATRLGQAIAQRAEAHPGQDGVYALSDGREAFALRMALIEAAQKSLDLQYYIWRPDTAGQLMFEALWKAAERGVRVRLLLDDNVTGGLDAALAALQSHPNIQVRLFNPYANRGLRIADIAGDFTRINRRMHNKAFIADNQVAIVGGRNIGNEYFSAGPGTEFVDLDVALAGPAVRQTSGEFDLYWNCESAYPAERFIAPADATQAAQMLQAWAALAHEAPAQQYLREVRETTLMRQLLSHSLPLEWTTARIFYDDPSKVVAREDRADGHLLPQLLEAMGKPRHELDLVSPYFVPGEEGTRSLTALSAAGVRVRILTNALAATDVAAVHAGYRKYRKALLAGGVTLYELKPVLTKPARRQERAEKEERGEGHPYGSGGSSASSLHAKTFALDRLRVFVGSFNFDPRSARLNTEMGVVLESPVLAARLSGIFDERVPDDAYEVRLASDGGLEWIERSGDGERIWHNEPETGWLRRTWIRLLSVLPIEDLL
ncbi:phospholipase D family protein [Noviherbaspirillum sp. DKR-6]|uniref:Phospholipase D family protein n=2 Tax=Noviherbaspirillum pedocola TaxID=2801341 RepID=A0A934T0M5_9BURK|nr:phospholipase D family protein [Noviherbaspirillum pedocola]